MGKLFGTDGVRGIANQKLTCELAMNLGRAATQVLTRDVDKPRVLIGRDTRISCDMLEAALCAGITSVGGRAELIGVLPTPALAYLTREYAMDAGVMISASHNAMEHNGIKWVDRNGLKLPDAVEHEIENRMAANAVKLELPTGGDVGVVVRREDAAKDYVKHILSTTTERLDGMRVVLDCAQGAAYRVAPQVFRALGAEVVCYYDQPDGKNINAGCGSTDTEDLLRLVVQHGATVGLAFDGDADRLICADENGKRVDGDLIMSVLAMDMHRRGRLAKDTLVATVMTNLGVHKAMQRMGIRTLKTDVGDRYVLAEMLRGGYNLGGEQSGHVILADFARTGDGILTAVQLLSVMRRQGKALSELTGAVTVLPQEQFDARVSERGKTAYAADPEVIREIARIEEKYAGNGRVLIRPSGTESLVRVMIEGKDREDVMRECSALARMIEQKFCE